MKDPNGKTLKHPKSSENAHLPLFASGGGAAQALFDNEAVAIYAANRRYGRSTYCKPNSSRFLDEARSPATLLAKLLYLASKH